MRRECICRGYLLLFSWVGHNLSEAAAARVAAHSAPALKEAVQAPLLPIDGWGLPPIPLNTGGGARCCRCVVPRCVLFLGGGVLPGVKNRRDLHPIRRYRRWRGLLKGWVVPTMPTRELYVQGTQEPQLPGIEPPHWTTEDYRSRYWAVYVSYQFSCSAN